MELQLAILKNDLPTVKRKVKSDNVNHMLYGDIPLLVCACKDSCIETAEWLIGKGADVNKSDSKSGNYPLNSAAINGAGQILALLLQQPDINVNVTGENGYTPLHDAACYGHRECVRLLLQHPGIDRNMKNEEGETARDVAMEVVKPLFDEPLASLVRQNEPSNEEKIKRENKTVRQSGPSKENEIKQKRPVRQMGLSKKGEIKQKKAEIARLNVEVKNLEIQNVDDEIAEATAALNHLNGDIERLMERKPTLEKQLRDLQKKKDEMLSRKEQVPVQKNNHSECPVCLEVMKLPKLVLQCRMGHTFCSECKTSLKGVCPICREELPEPDVRCLVLEQIINGV